MAGALAVDAWGRLPRFMQADDEGAGLGLQTWLAGILDQLQGSADVIGAGAALGDPATCPGWLLSWLATLGGVDPTLLPSDEGALRAAIATLADKQRGTEAAIAERVGLILTGTREVAIDYPVPGESIRVTTWSEDTPTPAGVIAAAVIETPAWLIVGVQLAEGALYSTWTTRYATYAAMTATGKTYGQLKVER